MGELSARGSISNFDYGCWGTYRHWRARFLTLLSRNSGQLNNKIFNPTPSNPPRHQRF